MRELPVEADAFGDLIDESTNGRPVPGPAGRTVAWTGSGSWTSSRAIRISSPPGMESTTESALEAGSLDREAAAVGEPDDLSAGRGRQQEGRHRTAPDQIPCICDGVFPPHNGN